VARWDVEEFARSDLELLARVEDYSHPTTHQEPEVACLAPVGAD
jgi:hypothetical protein